MNRLLKYVIVAAIVVGAVLIVWGSVVAEEGSNFLVYFPIVMKPLAPTPTPTPTSIPTYTPTSTPTPKPDPTRPPWPTATITPTPTITGTPTPEDTRPFIHKVVWQGAPGDLYYIVLGSGIGWKLFPGHGSSDPQFYGEFAGGKYDWKAETAFCGSGSGYRRINNRFGTVRILCEGDYLTAHFGW